MNGYVLFTLGAIGFIIFALVMAYGIARLTTWEAEQWRKGFIEREGREPRADEWPEIEYGK